VFILRPDLDEEATEAAIQRVLGQITGMGATVQNVDRWGKRRLSYEIKDQREGTYVLVKLQAEPGQTAEIERNLRIAGDVLRYLVVKLES
jgi:small subunit ribosomal protein S6